MKLRFFDFRRLCDEYDTALIGKRVILGNTIDDIFYAVEDDTDKGEILTKGQTDDVPFWSEENGDYFWYAYVLDEDFVEEPEKEPENPLVKVSWVREDVRNSLGRSLAREVTEHDVCRVIYDIDWDKVEEAMIERGRDIIDMAVIDCISRQ